MADVPVTYIRDPGVTGAAFVTGGTVSVMPVPGQVIPVYVASGSVSFNLNPGDVNIGAVEIEDKQSGLRASVHTAEDTKLPSETVMVVQHIDEGGNILSQTTLAEIDTNTAGANVLLLDISDSANAIQETGTRHLAAAATGNSTLSSIQSVVTAQESILTAMLNHQGTQATSANQAVANSGLAAQTAVLTAILNGEGTLATAVGQAEQRALLTTVLNNQGTLATAAAQATMQATLTGILNVVNSQGTTTPQVYTLFSNRTTPGASASYDISAYVHHTIQHTITGSVVVQVRTSLDGINWAIEDDTNQSGNVDLYGKAKWLSANIVYINGTVTTLAMSGN